MLTYADGVHVTLATDSSEIRSLTAFGRHRAPAADREILLALLFGLDDAFAEDERVAHLLRRRMVTRKKRLDDPDIEARLDMLGGQWAWQRPSGAPGRLFARLYAATRRAHARRKVWVRAFGQTPCMPETAVRRALLEGPGHKRILCIGDDDLVSIPLAMLGHEVTVYDVDDAVLIPFLNATAAEWKLPIRAVRRDLMATQRRARRLFDTVFTDPMSTRECFDLFLSRGLAWLRPGGRVYCAVHAMAVDTFLAVQRDMDFGLLDRHHDFNHYYESGFRENYYRSDMMVAEKLRTTRPVYTLGEALDLDLFSGELTNRQHHCGDLMAVDPVRFERAHVERAIERIKDSGLIRVAEALRADDETSLHYIAALEGGGYLGLAAFFDDHLVAYDLYPFSAGRDFAIHDALREEIPQSFSILVHKVARPARTWVGPER